MAKHADRRCERCQGWYEPTGASQVFCPMCIPAARAEAKRAFHNGTEKRNEKSVRKGVCHAGDKITPVPASVVARMDAWRYEQARRACAVVLPKSNSRDDIPTELQTIGPSIYHGERKPAATCPCGTKPGGRCVCRPEGIIG